MRPKLYTEYVGVFFRPETMVKLIEEAKKRHQFKDVNVLGEKLKQPKKGVSTAIREIVEEYLNRTLTP